MMAATLAQANNKPTFDDEFNKLSLDNGTTGTWMPAVFYNPNGSTDPSISSWETNPNWGPTSAPDANVYSVSNGVLSMAIKPTPADVSPSDVGNAPFLAGELTTYKSFAQTYGYFETRVELASGPGTISAFWLLPTDGSWPPELDAMEVLGNDPTTLVMTAHSTSPTAGTHWSTIPDSTQAFHTYGVDWEADKITWYFDGKQMAQEATPSDMHKPMYMLLDTMAGTSGSWVGAPNAGTNTQMQVDYVRAFAALPDLSSGGSPDPGGTATLPAMPPVTPLPSQGAYVTPGNGFFTDTAGNIYGIDVSGTADENGSAMAGASNTEAMQYFDGQVYGEDAASHNWYTWDQTTWTAASAPPPPISPPTLTMTDTLQFSLSEDFYQGDAQFTVAVDGKVLGPAQAVTALHSDSVVQNFVFSQVMAVGTHDVAVSFLNDAYGGSPAMDRNLYVQSIGVNGTTASDTTATLWSTGTTHFSVAVAAHL